MSEPDRTAALPAGEPEIPGLRALRAEVRRRSRMALAVDWNAAQRGLPALQLLRKTRGGGRRLLGTFVTGDEALQWLEAGRKTETGA